MKYLNTKPGSIEEVVANLSKHQNESGYQDMFKKELEKAGKGIGAMTPAEKKAFFNKIDDKYKAKNEETINENVSQVQVKRDGKGNFNLMFKGKEIGYYHKSGSKYMVYYDNEDGDYNQSDEVSSEMQAKKLAYDNMNEKVDNPYAVGMAVAKKMKNDEPPLKKSTITKAHDIAKSIAKEDSQELQKDKTDNYKDKNKEAIKEAKYPHKMYSKDGKEVEAKTPEDHEKYAKMGYTHKNETHSFMTKDMNKSKKDAKGEKEMVDPEPKLKQESMLDAVKNVWQMSAEQLEKIKNEAKYMKAQNMDKYKAEKDDKKNKKGTADTGSSATQVDMEPSVDYKN